jgi:hypothetical protein
MKGIILLLWLAAIVGEIRCIYQLLTSDFKPSYKREIIYGVCTITGIGAVVGYINIPDEPETK